MTVYFCQMVGFDKPDSWAEVDEYDARTAARVHAQLCDEKSPRLFVDPEESEQIVIVKDHGKFTATFDYSRVKNFYTKDG